MNGENVHFQIKAGTLIKFGSRFGIVVSYQMCWFPDAPKASVDPFIYKVFSDGQEYELVRESFVILQVPPWTIISRT